MDAFHVGTVDGGHPALIDPVGTVFPARAGWTLEWWIGADDRWRLPANEVAVRQHRVSDVAVVETSMRVPSGDAIQRVYGVAGSGSPLVFEIENASPAPFVLAFVVRGASRVKMDDATARIDNAFAITTSRAPSRWARTVGSPVQVPVTTGRAQTGPLPGARDRGARLEVAMLHPVAHRSTFRMVLTAGKPAPTPDPRTLPDSAAATRAWASFLDRAMRVELPDAALNGRIRAARAEVLLRGQARHPGASGFCALEDWGFDGESAVAWRRLRPRDRRTASTRPPAGSWTDALTADDDAEFLVAVRRILVEDRHGIKDKTVALLTELPPEWRGQSVEVRGAPIADGLVSYAVRWHGALPAVLWEAPAGITLRAPALDPEWSSTEPRGEALFHGFERRFGEGLGDGGDDKDRGAKDRDAKDRDAKDRDASA